MRLLRRGDPVEVKARYKGDVESLCAQVADYMAKSPVLVTMVSQPFGEEYLPSTIYCDGEWLWWETALSAVRDGAVPEMDFVAHVLATRNPPEALSESQIQEGFAAVSS